jgi:hypothetical protein
LFKKQKLVDLDNDSSDEATEEQANLKGSINEPVKDAKIFSDKKNKKIVVEIDSDSDKGASTKQKTMGGGLFGKKKLDSSISLKKDDDKGKKEEKKRKVSVDESKKEGYILKKGST